MKDPIETIAEHVITTQLADIPELAIKSAKTFFLDTIGVGLAGSRDPYVKNLLTHAANNKSEKTSRAMGQNIALAPGDAAIINGYQIHNSEFDCIHEEAVVHTMSVLLASVLADGDSRGGVDGNSMLRAMVLGVDVACNIGIACKSGLRFFRPATAGTFAAIAALGCIRNYNKPTLLNAFALGYLQVSGTMQAHFEGSPLLALQIGLSARNALTACDLAENGLPGLEGVLQGPFGYFNVIENGSNIDQVLTTLGRVWRITEIAHKPFPSGRATHGIIDAIIELKDAHTINAAEVRSVEAQIPKLTHQLVGRPIRKNMDTNYARLNVRYVAAVALQRGYVRLEDFSRNALQDEITTALAKKIDIVIDKNPNPNALSPVALKINMIDGAVYNKVIDTVLGHPSKPLDRKKHLTKFETNCKYATMPPPTANQKHLIRMVDQLEDLTDVRQVLDLITGAWPG